MLKNYYLIDENEQIGSFLKELNDKKNTHYIILNTIPSSFVDIRTISLKGNQPNEKLKNLKKPLSKSKGKNMVEHLNHLIESGDRVIETPNGYFDIMDGMQIILNENYGFLNEPISKIEKKEIYALNETDKISNAKSMFIQKRINLLPVIDKLEVIGEVRTIDLLVKELLSSKYDYRHEDVATNLPIENVMNKKPHTINKNSKIKEALTLMKEKKLPSIIVTDENNKIHSIISYKDIFKQVLKDAKSSTYEITYSGSSELYDDEFDLIQDYVEKTMEKIAKISNYDHVKVAFKSLGNTIGTHQKKIQVNITLSHGNRIIHVSKEHIEGTSDEERNDKVKGKWNVPQIVQEALKTAETKVLEEKRKNK